MDKYNLTEENKTDFIESFSAMNKLTKGHVHGLINPREYETVWTFEGAFYFCTTAITTIGEIKIKLYRFLCWQNML